MTSPHGEEIRRITLYGIRLPLIHPFRTSFGVEREKYTYLVVIETRSGEQGYGECVAGKEPRYSYESVDIAAEVVDRYIIPSIDSTASTPQDFMERVGWIKGHNMAKASLEMALWDLNARLAGKPLYRYIGGVRRYGEVGVSIGIQSGVEQLLRRIASFLEEGYRRIKVKIEKGLEHEILGAVRREYPDIPLTADANGDYMPSDQALLTGLDRYRLLYLEQPYPWWSIRGHAELARSMETPICLDETVTNRYVAIEAMDIGAAEVINIKPGRVGGLSESIAIHDEAMERGVPVWIGGMLETGVGRGFNVALTTLPNVRYPSDVSASKRYYERDVVDKPWEVDSQGRIWVPEEPGIGVEIDWDYLEKITIWKRVYRLGWGRA